jgi:hypothetical protein
MQKHEGKKTGIASHRYVHLQQLSLTDFSDFQSGFWPVARPCPQECLQQKLNKYYLGSEL